MSASPGWSLVPTRPVVRTCERRARRRSLGGRAAPWLAWPAGRYRPKAGRPHSAVAVVAVAPGFICRRAAGHVLYSIGAPWRRAFIAASVRARAAVAGRCPRTLPSSSWRTCVRLWAATCETGRRAHAQGVCTGRTDGTWRAARTSMNFFFKYCCARWPDVKASTTPAAGLKLNRNCSFIYASECHGHMARESRLGC